MLNSGLSFVLSNLSVEGELPYELADGNFFRRAERNEIEIFRRQLERVMTGGFYSWPRYDCRVAEEKHGNRTTFHFEELPEEEWRYWVVSYNGSNVFSHKLQKAAFLLETDFDIGLDVIFDEPDQQGKVMGWVGLPLHLIDKYSSSDEAQSNARVLKVKELETLKEIMELVENLPTEYDFVSHAFKNFSSIRMVPRYSELRTVGYFAIIEALITHSPRLTETLDSISHQIRNKAMLVRKRFGRRIEMKTYFLPASEEKIWNLLYGYRSCLAHGSKPDFDKKFLLLKNQDAVVEFLREFLKELLIFALRDPEFLMDLKRC